jgi:hypothetical protein
MSESNHDRSKWIIIPVVMVIIVLGASTGYQLTKPLTAQIQPEDITGNQTSNQTGGLSPPRVIEEEAQEEILQGQQ